MIEVSVVVALYNPIWEKLEATLLSILNQKNLNFEIILCDDASGNNLLDEIRTFLSKNNFSDYKTVIHEDNVGTVSNYIDGIEKASGKYVFLTSPGDLLFDENTLHDFFDEAEKSNAKIMFGDAVHYWYDSNKNSFEITEKSDPQCPMLYKNQNKLFKEKTALLFGNKILGAAYFRERESCLKYFYKARQSGCKYMEDTTSSLWALYDGVGIKYFNRKIVWYEYGGGMSTSGNNKFRDILINETKDNLKSLLNSYNDSLLKFALSGHDKNGMSKLRKIISFPHIYMRIFMNKFCCKNKFSLDEKYLEYMKKIFYEIYNH